jgi:mono/diheme cytochrome c family protein
MKKQLPILISALMFWPLSVLAETPQQILEQLVRNAGSPASVQRGEQIFRAKPGQGEAESCMSCHTNNPKAAGQHFRSRKLIEPLAVVANAERFTDPAKVEKWFKRNCKDVFARSCTAQEKADFTAYMLSVK